jgi:hypothetical protein
MNFLTFKKYLQSDNDGTFWPGYIELPDEENPIEIDDFQTIKKKADLLQTQEYTQAWAYFY